MDSSEFNFSGDNATAQTLNNFHGEFQNINEMNLSDEMVVNAIERACDFFHLPKVPVYNAESSCVWPNEPTTTYDDAFGYNRQELMNLGINGEDSLMLIYTHECAHRALQSYKNLDSWEHELACDFFSGIHAGMKGIDAQNVCESLGKTHGSLTHPTGTLRADFIEYGIEVAKDMDARKIPITVESCLERFNQHLIAKDDNIMECKNAINNLITPPNDTVEHPLGLYSSGLNIEGDKETTENSIEESKYGANVSFVGKYNEAEIAKLRDDVEKAKSKVANAKNNLENWESKLSLNNTEEKRRKGAYDHVKSLRDKAQGEYDSARLDLKEKECKLRNAT